MKVCHLGSPYIVSLIIVVRGLVDATAKEPVLRRGMVAETVLLILIFNCCLPSFTARVGDRSHPPRRLPNTPQKIMQSINQHIHSSIPQLIPQSPNPSQTQTTLLPKPRRTVVPIPVNPQGLHAYKEANPLNTTNPLHQSTLTNPSLPSRNRKQYASLNHRTMP